VNENPLYLLIDAKGAAPPAKELPVYVFESEVHLVNESPVTQFVKLGYKIETVDAERISVDHIARVIQASGTGSMCK
jgi:COP9 signalosome complex subunit 6